MNQENIVKSPMPFSTIMAKMGHAELYSLLYEINSLVFQAEYETVKQGIRKANVYHIDSQNYDNDINKISCDGLVYLPILRSKKYEGFSHNHFLVNDLGPDTMVYGVVARSLKDAKEFRDASNGVIDHNKIGELLGYPRCCSEYFVESWKRSFDPVFEVAQNTINNFNDNTLDISDAYPEAYCHLRYFGLRVVPWFPCSNKCKSTLETSEQWLDVMRKINKKTTDELINLISMPSSWSLSKGQVITDHPQFIGYAASYYTSEKREIFFR